MYMHPSTRLPDVGTNMAKRLADTLKQLPALFKEQEEPLDERERELKRLKVTLEQDFPGAGKPDDVLHLDVGGTHISVLRRTLTQVEGSMLASKFSGRWDESIEKSSEDRFFIDQPIELFLPLINYLRAMASETPLVRPPTPPKFKDGVMQLSFNRVVEYYGMGLGVYPVGVYLLDPSRLSLDKTLVASHPDYGAEADKFSTFCLFPLDDRHSQPIRSFAVRLASDDGPAKIGWLGMRSMVEMVSQYQIILHGVGHCASSVACCRALF
jgi:hypothetical protein